MFVHGVLLSVPAYAISHETAHGTAFHSHWLNETVLWTGSLIYMEEPLHRRYTHTNHHTFTWHVGKDSQMPFDTPMTLGGWLAEVSGFGLMRLHATVMLPLASGRYSDMMKMVAPEDELLRWLAVLAAIAVDALDRLQEHPRIEPVRIVRTRRRGLPDPDIEHEAAKPLDLVEQAVREPAKLGIPGHVRDRVEAGPLFLPQGGVFPRPLDLEGEKLALALEEPGPKTAHRFRRQDEARKPEYRALLVSGVLAADVGADMSELVEIGE